MGYYFRRFRGFRGFGDANAVDANASAVIVDENGMDDTVVVDYQTKTPVIKVPADYATKTPVPGYKLPPEPLDVAVAEATEDYAPYTAEVDLSTPTTSMTPSKMVYAEPSVNVGLKTPLPPEVISSGSDVLYTPPQPYEPYAKDTVYVPIDGEWTEPTGVCPECPECICGSESEEEHPAAEACPECVCPDETGECPSCEDQGYVSLTDTDCPTCAKGIPWWLLLIAGAVGIGGGYVAAKWK